jgi:integrase
MSDLDSHPPNRVYAPGLGTPKRTRRERRERNLYQRPDGRFEIGYRDSTGRQRWQVVKVPGLKAARAERDTLLGKRGKGEHVEPSPRLRFGSAAERWLNEQVSQLRPSTRTGYTNAVRKHLLPRWGRRRLDVITVDDAARLVKELRAEGYAEWTISGVLTAASRCFTFAQRRMRWRGQNPIGRLEKGERPKTASTPRRRIFRGDELAQTLAAASEPWRTLFALYAVSGARLSELLGLTWRDVDLSVPAEATVSIAWQVDRRGKRQPLKTEEGWSERVIELPRQLGIMLLEHKARSSHSGEEDFVFATRSGKALGQRNVLRALRAAQKKARTAAGAPTFPVLHERDKRGKPVRVSRGAVPNVHSFRHTAASEAIAAGESAEEVSWTLGHKNSVVTRQVYVQEIKSAERRARRRARTEARYGVMLEATVEATDRARAAADAAAASGEVVDLQAKRDRAQ